jgi:hypothetical protein
MLLDRGKYTQHEWNLFFMKISAWSEHMHRMDCVDCTRISHTLARKLAPLCTTGPISRTDVPSSQHRECLDAFLIFHEKQLSRLLKAYVVYFNQARPHQGLGQRLPEPPTLTAAPFQPASKVLSIPVLGGLHHDYQRAA